MNSSSGLGRPGPGQPDFDRPAPDPGWSDNIPPAQFGAPSGFPQQSGAAQPSGSQPSGASPPLPPRQAVSPSPAPSQQGRPQADAPPAPWGPPSLAPSGPPAAPPRRRGVRVMLVVSTLVVVVVALGLLAWQLLPGTPASAPAPSAGPATAVPPPAASAEPTVVRTPEAPRLTTSAQVSGGGIGSPVTFRTQDGEARVTVNRAAWADNGVLAPAPGTAYLVLDVTFEGVSGEVTTGGFFTAVREPGGARHLMAVGAQLDSRLAMRTIGAGQDNTGQVAFEVTRGPVAFEILDERLDTVAEVDVPG